MEIEIFACLHISYFIFCIFVDFNDSTTKFHSMTSRVFIIEFGLLIHENCILSLNYVKDKILILYAEIGILDKLSKS